MKYEKNIFERVFERSLWKRFDMKKRLTPKEAEKLLQIAFLQKHFYKARRS